MNLVDKFYTTTLKRKTVFINLTEQQMNTGAPSSVLLENTLTAMHAAHEVIKAIQHYTLSYCFFYVIHRLYWDYNYELSGLKYSNISLLKAI